MTSEPGEDQGHSCLDAGSTVVRADVSETPRLREEALVQPATAERTFTRALLQTYGARLCLAAFGFATSVITARALGASGRGELAILTAVPALVALAFEFGQEGTASHLAARSARARAALHVNILCYCGLVFFPGFALSLFAFTLLLDLGDSTPALAAAAAASVVSVVYFYGASGVLLGVARLGVYNVARVLSTAGFFVAVAFLAAAGQASATRLFVAAVAGHLAVALFLALNLRRFRAAPDVRLAREQVRTGFPLHLSNLGQVLLYRADQIVLFSVVGAASAGHYVVSVNVAEAMWALPIAAGALSVPYLSAPRAPEEKRRALVHALRLSLWLALIGGGVLAAGAPFAVPFVFGNEFEESVAPLQLLLPGIVAASVGATAMGSLVAARRFAAMIAIAGGALAVNVALMVALIPRLEAKGAAVASTVAYVVLGAGALAVATNVWQVSWGACLRPPLVPSRLRRGRAVG